MPGWTDNKLWKRLGEENGMHRTTKSYRPGFDALEDRALMSANLVGSTLGTVSKPLTTGQGSVSAPESQTSGGQTNIIAILIGL